MKIKQCIFFLLIIFFVGCNRINEQGFYTKSKIHSITNTKYDKEGYDFYGLDKEGFYKFRVHTNGWDNSGINIKTKTRYDIEGWDINGWNKYGINKETNKKFNNKGLDYNNIDENGNPNFLCYREKQSDEISEIYNEILDLKKPEISKEEFEKTADFLQRKNEIIKEFEQLTKQLSNKIYVYNSTSRIDYDADKACWTIPIDRILNSDFKKVGSYKARDGYGREFWVDDHKWDKEVILFTDKYDNINNASIKTIEIPMELKKAENSERFFVQYLYKIKSYSKESLYSYYQIHYPTIDSPSNTTEERIGLFAKYVGIIVWNNNKEKILYAEINDKKLNPELN